MKKKLFLIIIILFTRNLLPALPLAGVSGISGNTERASALALILEQHTFEIFKKNSFNTIQPDIIKHELTKFNCTEEKCILDFASNANIDLIVSGTVIDKKNSIIIKLKAYGINFPFNKRIINMYQVRIPLDVSINTREFSLISEEHAAGFLGKTLSKFQYPIYIKRSGNELALADDLKVNGKFKIYQKDTDGSIRENGEAEISNGIVTTIHVSIQDGNFILYSFKNKSDEIHQYYTARKREIVFEKTPFYDSLFILAIVPFASASMPLSSPFLGYYMNNDWSGLGLWMINAPPYLYIEARGLINSPSKLKNKKEDISRDDRAMNYFAWYMLCSGGMPLFIDSYAMNYLHKASYFTGDNLYLGNTATAAILSLTSNGAGHFYRGDRFWGYFYFHLNNILLYTALREFCTPEYYDEVTDTYTKGNTNRKRCIAFTSIFVLSKTVETIHATLKKENLTSGEAEDEYVIPSPLFTVDDRGNPVYGFNISLKF